MKEAFLPESDGMGRLARAFDWSRHPLGIPSAWPAALKTAVGMMLRSHFPMFLTWGEERSFLYNDAYAPILGAKHPEAFGRPFEKVWAEIWPDLVPLVEAVDRGEARFHENLKLLMLRHGFEEETFFTFSYSPLVDEEGAVRGLYCACIETTAQLRLEDSLKKSRESLHLAVSSAQMGTWEIDLATGQISFSEEAAEILGTGPRYEGVDLSIAAVIHPEDRERALERVRAASDTYADEYRVVGPGASLRWVQARGRVQHDSDGRPRILTGVLMDITEKRLAADSLAEARSRLDLALLSSRCGFWDWNARTGYTYLSQMLMEDWGIDPATYGNTLPEALERIHIDDRASTWASIEQATFEGRPYDVEYRVVRPSGEEIWINAKGKYYVGANGAPERLSGITVNITERKRTEAALRNAVSARDHFLSIASHELKTPLTSLRLQAQLHRRMIAKGHPGAFEPKRVESLVEQTEKQTNRLARLVDDMLDVSRIRSGKLPMRRELFNLSLVAEEVVGRLAPQFTGAGYAPPLVPFDANAEGDWDRLRIEQVLNNLLTNAIRYGNGQPVEVQLSSMKESVSLTVKDRGIGIDPAAREKIFDRFERGVDANEVSGLGLGLFIARQIVVAHGGTLTVESELGQGSSFTMALPKHAPPFRGPEEVNAL